MKGCDNGQRMGQLLHPDEVFLHPQIVLDPF